VINVNDNLLAHLTIKILHVIHSKTHNVSETGFYPLLLTADTVTRKLCNRRGQGSRRQTNQEEEERKKYTVRVEAFTAVTMKNVVFWDIKTQFVLHRRHITSPLQSTAS
jgi:hypothetical protein